MKFLSKFGSRIFNRINDSNGKYKFIGFMVLFIDGILNTVIGPIMPSYLINMKLKRVNLSIADFNGEVYFNGQVNNASVTDTLHQLSEEYNLVDLNILLTLLYTSKPTFQLIVNPFVGYLTSKIGYTIPITIGLIIASFSTLLFAIGSNFIMLIISRLIQGTGTSLASVSAFGLCAHIFQKDDNLRGKVISIAMSGVATGMLIGPVVGGVLYQFAGLVTPFCAIAIIILLTLTFQLIFIKPTYYKTDKRAPSSFKLLKDPYILLVACGIVIGNIGDALFEPTFPYWLLKKFSAPPWMQGLIMTAPLFSYLLSNNFLNILSEKWGRWCAAIMGFSICATAFYIIPLSVTSYMVAIFYGIFGFGLGLIESSLMPIMAHLVDIRHDNFYGSVYAIADNSFNLAFSIGNSTAGLIVSGLSFNWLCWITAIILTIYTPFLFWLRNPPHLNPEQKVLLPESIELKQ